MRTAFMILIYIRNVSNCIFNGILTIRLQRFDILDYGLKHIHS